jgi:hypothetical protein
VHEYLVPVGQVEPLERRNLHGLHLLLKRGRVQLCETWAQKVAVWGVVV